MAAEVASSNQSVDRALSVLKVFTGGRSELRVSDVAKAAGLGLSTASRLLATLEAAGFVDRDPVSGLYRLGLDVVWAAAGHPAATCFHQPAWLATISGAYGFPGLVAVKPQEAIIHKEYHLCTADPTMVL